MKLLLNTHCCNEFVDDCSYAFIDLTPSVARLILKRASVLNTIRRADDDLQAMEFYSAAPYFLDRLPDDPEGYPMEVDSDEPFTETGLSLNDLLEYTHSTECDRMVIGRDDVYWACYPKHSNWLIETRPVDYDTVRKAAGL